jgi:hypothetical protein
MATGLDPDDAPASAAFLERNKPLQKGQEMASATALSLIQAAIWPVEKLPRRERAYRRMRWWRERLRQHFFHREPPAVNKGPKLVQRAYYLDGASSKATGRKPGFI